MFGELTKVFTEALAGQFGWLAVGLAIIPLGIVLASHWFWKESQKIAQLSAQLSQFQKIVSQRYLAKCSDSFQNLIGDPITSTRKFLYRSGLVYLIALLVSYFIISVFFTKIEISLIFPSKYDDFLEVILSVFLGYFVFLFCLAQSMLFLDLCRESRSSWQVFYALIADIFLTFAAVAIFSGMVDASYSWSVYGHEKRRVTLEIEPSNFDFKAITRQQISEIEIRTGITESDLYKIPDVLTSLKNSIIGQKWPITTTSIYHKKSVRLLQKENNEFDEFYQFNGFEKTPENIEIEKSQISLSNSFQGPVIDIISRMKDERSSCLPFTVQILTFKKLDKKGKPESAYINANVIPNLNSIDFGKLLRENISHHLQRKWYAISSGFLHSMDANRIVDIRNPNILTDECHQFYKKADQLVIFKNKIFSSAFYIELDSDRSSFWNYSITSFYYSLACFLTSILLIFVLTGLLLINIYNFSSAISSWMFSFKILEDISSERRSVANAVVLGIVIFCTVGILRGIISLAFG